MNARPPFTEFNLIEWIRKTTPPLRRHPVGIGDDAAVLQTAASGQYVITTDMVLEGTHFEAGTPAYRIGWKAAARSLSDVAAMGCPAAAVTVCVVFSKGGCDWRFARNLFRGIRALCAKFGIPLVGGDISSWRGPLALNVTALGDVSRGSAILRSGAKKGDRILVSGRLGGSILGRHLRFVPRLDLGVAINRRFKIHSMIDISDGLAADLRHIIEESRVGGVLDARSIPVSRDAVRLARKTGKSALEHALFDGEDYELLFTAAPREAERILRARLPVPVSMIGSVTGQNLALRQVDGTTVPLRPGGYEHALA